MSKALPVRCMYWCDCPRCNNRIEFKIYDDLTNEELEGSTDDDVDDIFIPCDNCGFMLIIPMNGIDLTNRCKNFMKSKIGEEIYLEE